MDEDFLFTMEEVYELAIELGLICEAFHSLNQVGDCTEVFPNLYVGNERAAQYVDCLRMTGVTHVVNTAAGRLTRMAVTDPLAYQAAGIKYLGLPLADRPETNIRQYFGFVSAYIDNALRQCGKVLVHCVMGISRSVTIATAYLMMKQGMSAAHALATIGRVRRVRPNNGFLQQLAYLDYHLQCDKYCDECWCCIRQWRRQKGVCPSFSAQEAKSQCPTQESHDSDIVCVQTSVAPEAPRTASSMMLQLSKTIIRAGVVDKESANCCRRNGLQDP